MATGGEFEFRHLEQQKRMLGIDLEPLVPGIDRHVPLAFIAKQASEEVEVFRLKTLETT